MGNRQVPKGSKLVARAGQEELYAVEGETVVLTARLNKEADE